MTAVLGLDGDRHHVGLREVAHAFPAQLAADAGLGEAAERGALVDRGRVVVVEEGDAGAELASDARRVRGVTGSYRRAQARPGGVGQPDGLLLVVVRDDRQRGAELFFRHDAERRVGVKDEGRQQVVAAVQSPVYSPYDWTSAPAERAWSSSPAT